jgi:DNA-binding transcriptional MerR regulator
MAKRIKRPLVKPMERREWLRRLEEQGLSLSELAKVVDYDVRTVKKQIEMAHQERESHEARFFVLRQALEKHYADLLSFVERLDSGIIHSSLSMGIKDDRMWVALHEHLPRSPLWKLIDKMEHLNEKVRDIEKRAEQHLLIEVRTENSFKLVSQSGVQDPGLYDKGLLGAMNYQLHQNLPCTVLDITISSISDDRTTLYYAGCACAVVPPGQVEKAKEFITNLIAQVCSWPEYEELGKTLSERTKMIDDLREELATIILKRVIPGHCKYCPV